MAASTVYLRCPTCGGDLRVELAAEPPTQWFPCPHCHTPVPVVAPRDLPPLYSWEVLPGLYPELPRPRVPKWRVRRAAAAALLVVAVVSAGLAAGLVVAGWEAAQPARYTISGTVVGTSGAPIPGADVTLANDANQSTSALTGFDGTFSFSNVPEGGVALNVSASGYAPATVYTFVSNVYATQSTGLEVTLSPGTASNGTTTSLTPFPDMEQFLASVGAAAVLLGIIALVAGFAAVATVREDRPPVGVIGGAAGLLSPLTLVYLSLSSALPLLIEVTAISAGAGAFVLAMRAMQLAQTGPAPDPD
ncbi:MAG TPA: carboxypeptidase-like regulatory domain-containing protein [Thermoplasmata archaeon]|nr:carboxypeptidase-like regulatory domain-containing protein [Thermoplasmata archaeon]